MGELLACELYLNKAVKKFFKIKTWHGFVSKASTNFSLFPMIINRIGLETSVTFSFQKGDLNFANLKLDFFFLWAICLCL